MALPKDFHSSIVHLLYFQRKDDDSDTCGYSTADLDDIYNLELEDLVSKGSWNNPPESWGDIQPVQMGGSDDGSAKKYEVSPCDDCKQTGWTDWSLRPNKLFNKVCPHGKGYLCLPCFSKRVIKQEIK